ncbi:hypothetical protein BGZ76_002118, partial [Entomortierella beljakovae]
NDPIQNDPYLRQCRDINELNRQLDKRERELKEREENLLRSTREIEERYRQLESNEITTTATSTTTDIDYNPFACDEPLIRNYSDSDSQLNDHSAPESSISSSAVNSRAAKAILRHDLSANYQENINPFQDPLLIENTSSPSNSNTSSVHGDDDDNNNNDHDDSDGFTDADQQSVTVGNDDDDEEEFDWTDAEVNSVVSEESIESWGAASQ